MSTKIKSRVLGVAAIAMGVAMPLLAHHSFAAYDMEKRIIVTGVVTRVNPDANHLQIFFARMNPERKNVERDKDNKPIIWSIEMAGSAASAQDGISVNAFPEGTIFSAAVHPQRSGDASGFREGPLFKCPVAPPATAGAKPKAIPPKAGMHCDSVQGSTSFGQGKLPAPTS